MLYHISTLKSSILIDTPFTPRYELLTIGFHGINTLELRRVSCGRTYGLWMLLFYLSWCSERLPFDICLLGFLVHLYQCVLFWIRMVTSILFYVSVLIRLLIFSKEILSIALGFAFLIYLLLVMLRKLITHSLINPTRIR